MTGIRRTDEQAVLASYRYQAAGSLHPVVVSLRVCTREAKRIMLSDDYVRQWVYVINSANRKLHLAFAWSVS